ncbi:pectinesterase [Trifolium pratense]|uniref:Pectinesterase n=1 Tax=Trifolium pratense TaxID=57577 RepID=A0A2K3JW57_TRIPR|nr:pectinesterase [Trifolium pratense]
MKFSSMKLIIVKGVRQHIKRMRDIAAQLKTLEINMSESFLVHYIFCTLPSSNQPFIIPCNTHKDKWSVNELLTMRVQEERKIDDGNG